METAAYETACRILMKKFHYAACKVSLHIKKTIHLFSASFQHHLCKCKTAEHLTFHRCAHGKHPPHPLLAFKYGYKDLASIKITLYFN